MNIVSPQILVYNPRLLSSHKSLSYLRLLIFIVKPRSQFRSKLLKVLEARSYLGGVLFVELFAKNVEV